MCQLFTTIWLPCYHNRERHHCYPCFPGAYPGICPTTVTEILDYRTECGDRPDRPFTDDCRGLCPDCLTSRLISVQQFRAMDRGNGANGASNGGVVRSPMSAGIPVSPASYWSDLTGYQTGSEAGHEHGPRERSASAQSYHSIPSIDRTDDSTESDRGHEDHSAESLVPGQPSLNAQNVAHTGDTTESDGDPETHQPIDEEVSPDELLPGPPSTRQAAVETLLTTQTMTTEVSIRDILNEQAPESETSNTESMPTTQALTTATSIRETSTENDSETISTEISTGQPSDKHGSIESPASGQQANEEPAPVTPVHRRSGHVSPHANRDTPSKFLTNPYCGRGFDTSIHRQHPAWRALCRAKSCQTTARFYRRTFSIRRPSF